MTRQWDPLYEDKQRAIRRLKIDVSRIDENLLVGEDEEPMNQFKRTFMRTGEYLRPHDMRYCVQKTNFTEEQVDGTQ